jgi:hypothetical protein
MKWSLVAVALLAVGCGDKKPAGVTVKVWAPSGWRGHGIRVAGQDASFDIDYAKFWKKEREQEVSEPLVPAPAAVEGMAVELVVNRTPCGKVTKPATLKMLDGWNETELRAKGVALGVEVVGAPKAPTSTLVIIDAPGAKSVKIGEHEIDERDLSVDKGGTLFEIDCAPLTVTIDGKPLEVKIVEGGFEGTTIQPATQENEKHEYVPIHDRTAAYLITTRTDTCYAEESRDFGAAGNEPLSKTLSGGNVYKLAWADVDFKLEAMPASVSVTVRSADEASRASASRTAVWAVPCPPPTP